MNRLAALVPLKAFDGAKSRLSDRLDETARSDLAAAMARDTLAALVGCGCFDADVHVVTSAGIAADWVEARAADFAIDAAASILRTCIETDAVQGLNGALRFGLARIAGHCGADTDVVIVPADLPLLRPEDLRTFVDGAVRPGVTVVSDARADGTNAMLLAPLDAIEPQYGIGSGARHLDAARAAGRDTRRLTLANFLIDVDFPADLDRLLQALEQDDGVAPATRACLQAHGLTARH